ncbi:MAG: nucleotidyltransferase domain-containing protein, partial [Candidatus Hodarchaeales archaeon]
MREKVEKKPTTGFIPLTAENRIILNEKREKAAEILEVLTRHGIHGLTYGSICRGDANKRSDIDIIVPSTLPSYKIEIALDNYHFEEKIITQATPNHAIKGVL